MKRITTLNLYRISKNECIFPHHHPFEIYKIVENRVFITSQFTCNIDQTLRVNTFIQFSYDHHNSNAKKWSASI